MPELGAVAIIPARGGSKRLPRKNVLPFNGRPVIEYTIEAAIQSGCFDRVIVSSEDDEILGIAAAANAEVDRRSNELGSDTATVAEVCADFLRRESSNGTDIGFSLLSMPLHPCDMRGIFAAPCRFLTTGHVIMRLQPRSIPTMSIRPWL